MGNSCARIATERVIAAIQQSDGCELVAIASRDKTRAQQTARTYGIERSFADYDALLQDANIDVIYLPLPNHLHVEWSIRALEAGKHVLCEKPTAISAQDLQRLMQMQRAFGLYVEEAFMVREHPQWDYLRNAVDEGRTGEIRNIQVSYSHTVESNHDIRMQADAGGGALMDVGCYASAIVRLLMAGPPHRVWAHMQRDSATSVDQHTQALLDYGDAVAQLPVSIAATSHQQLTVVGTTGWARVEVPFAHPDTLSARIAFGTNTAPGTEATEVVRFAPANQYQLQAERFARRIRGKAMRHYPLADAAENLPVLDAIADSARSGEWVCTGLTA